MNTNNNNNNNNTIRHTSSSSITNNKFPLRDIGNTINNLTNSTTENNNNSSNVFKRLSPVFNKPAIRISPDKNKRIAIKRTNTSSIYESVALTTTPLLTPKKKRLVSPTKYNNLISRGNGIKSRIYSVGNSTTNKIDKPKNVHKPVSKEILNYEFPTSPLKLSPTRTIGGDGSLNRIRSRFSQLKKNSPEKKDIMETEYDKLDTTPFHSKRNLLTKLLEEEVQNTPIKSALKPEVFAKDEKSDHKMDDPISVTKKKVTFNLPDTSMSSNDPSLIEQEQEIHHNSLLDTGDKKDEILSILLQVLKRQDAIEHKLDIIINKQK
ncbi:uncharacterized protein SCODWIG_00231 [Saccharomycodes ludwigii]|uniref:Uncharacterized protein n=1 Tax=Saccharomycodes ludwigii TaxID=36035 RepID=A0A376B2W4_9ASCO|nr:uncharacterized protein SCODWIG_00231 [Saccharomycodes ludwigii]